MTPELAAEQFVAEEQAFHLGFLPTEQAHPDTTALAATAQESASDACRLLFSVDEAMLAPLRTIFAAPAFYALHARVLESLQNGGRLVLSGCGATGRLCLLLEAAWRKAWSRAKTQASCSAEVCAAYAAAVRGIMTGGDYAFIRSVESFEDYEAFGARQVEELSLKAGDCLVGISEGGETSSVLGSIHAARACGASAGFVCNNPHALLREKIERSRRVLDDPHVICLECYTGPMALAGSTRMQATTSELLVFGTLLEHVMLRLSAGDDAVVPTLQEYTALALSRFHALMQSLVSSSTLEMLGTWVELEADVYRAGGAVTYFAEEACIDILTDTTERTPTFALPPFMDASRADAARPWAMVKHLRADTAYAWRDILGRDPVCLEWTAEEYHAMEAAQSLVEAPPQIHRAALAGFHIGMEPDATRHQHPCDTAILLQTESDRNNSKSMTVAFAEGCTDYPRSACVMLSNADAPDASALGGHVMHLRCAIPDSPLCLVEHLALKLVCNTVSTATMARIGRVTNNWMTHVQPTNKKLIDRSCRILSDCCGMPYEDACRLLYREILNDSRPLAERPSPVQKILGWYSKKIPQPGVDTSN